MRANIRKPMPQTTLKADAQPKKRGRPKVVTGEIVKLHRAREHPGYSEAVATEILDELAEGETLRSICRTPGMPSARTIGRWAMDDVHGFCDRYEMARRLQGDTIFDEVVDLTNQVFKDNVEVQAARLKVDARKWFLSKLLPDRFGDKVEITNRTEKLTDAEVDAQLLNLLETAGHTSLPQPARKLLGKPQR